MKITNKKKVVEITILFTVLYFVSYITRINYAAVISEIVSAEGISKSIASLALTASAVTYGLGQLVSGFLGDRIEPKKVIFTGLCVTIAMNFLIPFCKTPYAMTAAWAVNGMAQAFMWPPLVKLMTALFEREDYQKSCVIVSWGSSFGTIMVYLMSPVCIYLAGWRSVFFCAGAAAVIMAVVWMLKCPDIEASSENKNVGGGKIPRSYLTILIAIMSAIVLQGILRDGVTTWMPSYVSETFRLDSKAAILTGVVLPIFGIIVIQITSLVYRKRIKSELLFAGIIFAIGFAAAFLLFAANGLSAGLSVALSAILTGAMHGINLLLICMIPPYFEKFGNISFVSGLLNFCTYVGSSVSGYGIAVFSERYSWSGTLLLWSGAALAGAIICFAFNKRWEKIKK